MEVIYRSTRSNGAPVTASQAILKGLSDDGGLFVPDHIPTLDKSFKELAGMTMRIIWNCSMDPPLLLRIWHFPFYRI